MQNFQVQYFCVGHNIDFNELRGTKTNRRFKGFKIKRRTRKLDEYFFKKYGFKRDRAMSYSTGKLIVIRLTGEK